MQTKMDRKSTWGYVLVQAGDAISWKSSKQTCAALSTAEAEYLALSAAVQEALWLQQLTNDLVNRSVQEITVYKDNPSTLRISTPMEEKTHQYKVSFIRDTLETGRIKLSYCPTENMIGDILTKGLPTKQFEKLCHLAGVTELIYWDWGGVLDMQPQQTIYHV